MKDKNSVRTISISVLISSLLILGCAHAEWSTNVTKSLKYNMHGQILDLYMPQAPVKKTAIMFIHGGGLKKVVRSRCQVMQKAVL